MDRTLKDKIQIICIEKRITVQDFMNLAITEYLFDKLKERTINKMTNKDPNNH